MSVRPRSLLWAIVCRLPKLILGRGLRTPPHYYNDQNERPDQSLSARLRGRSVFIRHLDTGSSNASELSISALSNPNYDFERLGFHIVASPRHADLALVTGPLTFNLVPAAEATLEAMPIVRTALDPKDGELKKLCHIITVGDDAEDGGVFRGAYGILAGRDDGVAGEDIQDGCGAMDHLRQDHLKIKRIGHVKGPAPKPSDILEGLCDAVNRL